MTTNNIRQLIKQNREHNFYVSPDWRHLRAEVLKDDHYECQECRKRGKYSKANHVHHINHLRKHPELALSKTYIGTDGMEHRNLESVCKDCHETVCHPERLRKVKQEPWPEKWD